MNQTSTKRYEWEVTRDLHLRTVAFSHISYRQPSSLFPLAVPLHVLLELANKWLHSEMCVCCPSPGQSGGSCLTEKPKPTAMANWHACSEPREPPGRLCTALRSISHSPSPGELPHAELQWLWWGCYSSRFLANQCPCFPEQSRQIIQRPEIFNFKLDHWS